MSTLPWVSSAERLQAMLGYVPAVEPNVYPVATALAEPDYQPPSAVTKLAQTASEASWEVRVTYSRGRLPHARTGAPGALKDLIGLRFGNHPRTARRAYAIYSRIAPSGTWDWGSTMIWGPDLTPRSPGFTNLVRFLITAGSEW